MTSRVREVKNDTLDRYLRLLGRKYDVTIGIHAEEGSEKKKTIRKAGGPVEQDDRSLVEIASDHEFGVGVPRRSIVSDWFEQDLPTAQENIRKIARNSLIEGTGAEVALGRFAAWAVGRMQARLVAGISPELSEARKAEKKVLAGTAKDTPLILTGQIKASLRGKVNGKTAS